MSQSANLSYRDWLVKAHHTASQDYDKAVMTLAAGGLGISLAFIKDIAPHPNGVWMIAVGWSCLAASLLLIFVSYLTSQQRLLEQISQLDHPGNAARQIFGGWTRRLNWISGAAFIAGVVFVVAFAVYNMGT
jgi:TRAP-type C4-dicarboxylate transport system permease small subunit